MAASSIRTDKLLSNNASVQYGEKAMSELNASMQKLDNSTVFGVLALTSAIACDYADYRVVKQAAFGADRKAVGEALAKLADDLFGFDSINATKENGKKPEQKHMAQIKTCAVIASYLASDYTGAGMEDRVKLTNKGNKLMVAGRFLIEDSEDAEYDQTITITGARGRALSDLIRAAKAWNKKETETVGSAQASDDTRKKRVSELLGSVSGQAKMADVMTEELAKASKKGEKLHKDLLQSFGNLKAQIQELSRGDADTDSDVMGEISDIAGIVPYLEKQDEVIQDAMYALYIALDKAFGTNAADIATRNERKAA